MRKYAFVNCYSHIFVKCMPIQSIKTEFVMQGTKQVFGTWHRLIVNYRCKWMFTNNSIWLNMVLFVVATHSKEYKKTQRNSGDLRDTQWLTTTSGGFRPPLICFFFHTDYFVAQREMTAVCICAEVGTINASKYLPCICFTWNKMVDISV